MSNPKNSSPTPSGEDLLTTREALAYVRVSRPCLLKYARLHSLRRVQFGQAVRWPRSELDRLIRLRTKCTK